jgi:Undecaprenyl-phosphate galactose phosphotransferase WbaP
MQQIYETAPTYAKYLRMMTISTRAVAVGNGALKTNTIGIWGYWIRILALAGADILSFLIAGALFRYGHNVPSLVMFVGNKASPPSTPIDAFAVLCVFFIGARYLSGDYSRRQLFWDGAKITTIALIITSLPDFIMQLLGNGTYAGWCVLLSWTLLLFLVPLMRQFARMLLTRMNIWLIPTALIGIGPRTAEIFEGLRGSLSLGYDIRWLVPEVSSDSSPKNLSQLQQIQAEDPILLAKLVRSAGCQQVVITADSMQSAHFSDMMQSLLEAGISVAVVPSVNRLPLANLSTNYIFGRDILLMQVCSNPQRLPWRIAKRTFDIVAATFLLILLSPIFLAIAIAIKLDTSGPATYSQRRVGRHAMQFRCLKFRTMSPDADAILELWKSNNPALYAEFLVTFKLRNDPRITRVGKWLRKSSLDEFPQLWNVLRGEMSLVGPRPIPEQQLRDQYRNAAQLYIRVRPGITGLWQISGRSETTSDQRVILDEWYILNWSFWYDIVILIQTAWIVVSGKGAY